MRCRPSCFSCFSAQRSQTGAASIRPICFLRVRVADFHIAKDRMFAETNLRRRMNLSLYNGRYMQNSIAAEPFRKPDLVIYLQASVDALLATHRAPRHSTMSGSWIVRTSNVSTDAYAKHFFTITDETPLLIVNASQYRSDPQRQRTSISPVRSQVQAHQQRQPFLQSRSCGRVRLIIDGTILTRRRQNRTYYRRRNLRP